MLGSYEVELGADRNAPPVLDLKVLQDEPLPLIFIRLPELAGHIQRDRQRGAETGASACQCRDR